MSNRQETQQPEKNSPREDVVIQQQGGPQNIAGCEHPITNQSRIDGFSSLCSGKMPIPTVHGLGGLIIGVNYLSLERIF